MSIELIVFYFFAGILLASAILVVTVKNIVRSIFLFFITLFSVAGIYIFALADFVAVAQVIIYVGGVLVLMLFAFLLSNKELLNGVEVLKGYRQSSGTVIAILISLLFLVVLISTVKSFADDTPGWIVNAGNNQLQPENNTVHAIGISTMTRYLLPFEVVSIFLLMALIGAAHLARREEKS